MPYMLSIDATWARAADDEANIDWARDFWSRMQTHSNGRLYLNFPGHGEEGEELTLRAFGSMTYAKLAALKRKWDPANLFRMNQNILPPP
jgi:FAD/FMN-containing dehydrogenase